MSRVLWFEVSRTRAVNRVRAAPVLSIGFGPHQSCQSGSGRTRAVNWVRAAPELSIGFEPHQSCQSGSGRTRAVNRVRAAPELSIGFGPGSGLNFEKSWGFNRGSRTSKLRFLEIDKIIAISGIKQRDHRVTRFSFRKRPLLLFHTNQSTVLDRINIAFRNRATVGGQNSFSFL